MDSSEVTNRLDGKAIRERVAQLAWDMNYDQFCELIGEPATFTHGENNYAMDKWQAWQQLVHSLTTLGDYFDKLVGS